MKENVLTIIDSDKAYEKSEEAYTLNLSINLLTKRAESLGKQGLSNFADRGLFFLYERKEEMVKHELSVPTELGVNASAFVLIMKEISKLFQKSRKRSCSNITTGPL